MKPWIAPARLKSLPDLGAHEIVAAELATNGVGNEGEPSTYLSDHLDRVVAVRQHGALIAGRLTSVADSVESPLLVLRIGKHTTVAVHPSHPVVVAPSGWQLTVTATDREDRRG